uniref:Uncharacterized protein n=1 Tax=Chromera velia CCMP2878 TaxID=1169474 RepID=A0A0G4FCM8_9ALVE|mmetsp:Transcript_36346/g.71534  ORF Transcript_36346/g.71534 Transcript_36346/m.71534 type:complete len:673 (+) Transcript_36346:114-2132(+)|eukprot:Cvel_3213.t1-p1 / transcript=Cvel_3213.t1 / gene=Cvel_3213 / organism=Chromera_velia_CCMP2878 / gene_product=hypothetical protein / transcript_product=hypothetical protein / location=Cvel_scaffold125:99256-105868(+) / protein_length=672 / sequence_SO=supercontig / SO=protein_coding / is_pseudo=false
MRFWACAPAALLLLELYHSDAFFQSSTPDGLSNVRQRRRPHLTSHWATPTDTERDAKERKNGSGPTRSANDKDAVTNSLKDAEAAVEASFNDTRQWFLENREPFLEAYSNYSAFAKDLWRRVNGRAPEDATAAVMEEIENDETATSIREEIRKTAERCAVIEEEMKGLSGQLPSVQFYFKTLFAKSKNATAVEDDQDVRRALEIKKRESRMLRRELIIQKCELDLFVLHRFFERSGLQIPWAVELREREQGRRADGERNFVLSGGGSAVQASEKGKGQMGTDSPESLGTVAEMLSLQFYGTMREGVTGSNSLALRSYEGGPLSKGGVSLSGEEAIDFAVTEFMRLDKKFLEALEIIVRSGGRLGIQTEGNLVTLRVETRALRQRLGLSRGKKAVSEQEGGEGASISSPLSWLKKIDFEKPRAKVAAFFDFTVVGFQLIASDAKYIWGLLQKAVFEGYEFTPVEAQAFRRLVSDVLCVVPFALVLLIPLSPPGHVLAFNLIQRVFPNFWPSPFSERRVAMAKHYMLYGKGLPPPVVDLSEGLATLTEMRQGQKEKERTGTSTYPVSDRQTSPSEGASSQTSVATLLLEPDADELSLLPPEDAPSLGDLPQQKGGDSTSSLQAPRFKFKKKNVQARGTDLKGEQNQEDAPRDSASASPSASATEGVDQPEKSPR